MTVLRTDLLGELDPRVAVPGYDREQVSVGIVHLGYPVLSIGHTRRRTWTPTWPPGTRRGGSAPWGCFRRTPRSAMTEEARVIGSVVKHLHAPDDPASVLDVMADPGTRIVSLTITEGGYVVDDADDAAPRRHPNSAGGFIVAALARRRAAGTPPFTVMSCDNMQGNGHVAEAAVTEFAARRDPELGGWISENVAFPSAMVDRITPATTAATRETARVWGIDDQWPVRAESFAQWVVEDRFTLGRPALERVGVQFVDNVAPYEKLKLRLVNGSHQAMSYLGLLNEFRYVHEVCRCSCGSCRATCAAKRSPLSIRFLV